LRKRAEGDRITETLERLKVQVYMSTHTFTGYIRALREQRLLDILNGIFAGTLRTDEAFLALSEVTVLTSDRKEMAVQSAYVNKANILFVRAMEGRETSGLGSRPGHKLYPFVPKQFTMVKVYVAPYTLTGRMHYGKGQQVLDVLNSGVRFFPLTSVAISSLAGSSESGVSFIAVNRGQLLSLEELGTT